MSTVTQNKLLTDVSAKESNEELTDNPMIALLDAIDIAERATEKIEEVIVASHIEESQASSIDIQIGDEVNVINKAVMEVQRYNSVNEVDTKPSLLSYSSNAQSSATKHESINVAALQSINISKDQLKEDNKDIEKISTGIQKQSETIAYQREGYIKSKEDTNKLAKQVI